MRKILFTFLLFAFIGSAQNAFAQDYKLGLGIRLSTFEPTLSNSLSVKYFVDQGTALEGLLSFGGSRFGIGGLYEIHKPLNIQESFPGALKWYYGAGGYVGFQRNKDVHSESERNQTYLGPTGIVGLDYKFEKIPLNLSLDWKPELDILPKIGFVPDAFGLSVRFTLQ